MKMIWTTCSEVESNANVVGGIPVMKGTRVPVSAIFDNLEGGATIAEIVEWFPGVTEAQIKSILRFMAKSSAA